MVKNALADLAPKQFEIASYRALGQAARQIGEEKLAAVCDEICAQEESMARCWRSSSNGVLNALAQAKGD